MLEREDKDTKRQISLKLHRSTTEHHLQCILLKDNCKKFYIFYETQTKIIACVSKLILLLMTTAKFPT